MDAFPWLDLGERALRDREAAISVPLISWVWDYNRATAERDAIAAGAAGVHHRRLGLVIIYIKYSQSKSYFCDFVIIMNKNQAAS